MQFYQIPAAASIPQRIEPSAKHLEGLVLALHAILIDLPRFIHVFLGDIFVFIHIMQRVQSVPRAVLFFGFSELLTEHTVLLFKLPICAMMLVLVRILPGATIFIGLVEEKDHSVQRCVPLSLSMFKRCLLIVRRSCFIHGNAAVHFWIDGLADIRAFGAGIAHACKVDLIITQKVSNVTRKPEDITLISRLLATLPHPIGIYFISEDIFTLASYYQEDLRDKGFFPSGWALLPDDSSEALLDCERFPEKPFANDIEGGVLDE